jgi:outer membrane protein assembly factor BamB
MIFVTLLFAVVYAAYNSMKTLVKPLLFLFAFFSTEIVSKAQTFVDQHQTTKVVVGSNELDHKDIIANKYAFGYRIYKIYVDSIANNVTIQLRDVNSDDRYARNNGSYMLFDLKTNAVKWVNKIAFTDAFLNQNGNILLQVYGRESYPIDIQTGGNHSVIKNRIIYIDGRTKTGIGFDSKTSGGPKLIGVDLTNDSIKWVKYINRDFSRCPLSQLDDSTLLFTTSGLHTVNVSNGKGWDYFTETGDKHYRAPDQKAAQSTLGGIKRSQYKVFYAKNRVNGAGSNILIDGNYLYYASKEKIAKVDKVSGEIIWSFDFKGKDAGQSWLYLKDSVVYMINAGYAFKNNEMLPTGRPFAAAFNKNTGQEIFQKALPEHDFVISVKWNGPHAFLLFKNKITLYDLSNFQLLNQKETPRNEDDENVWFAKSALYINDGDSLSPNLRLIDSINPNIITNNRLLLQIGNDLNSIQTNDDSILYEVVAEKKNCKIIAKQDETEMLVLNALNKVIAKFNAPPNSQLIGNKLYGIDDNTLVETDLGDILK